MCVCVCTCVCVYGWCNIKQGDFKEEGRPLKVSCLRGCLSDADFYLVFIECVNSILYSCHECFSDVHRDWAAVCCHLLQHRAIC